MKYHYTVKDNYFLFNSPYGDLIDDVAQLSIVYTLNSTGEALINLLDSTPRVRRLYDLLIGKNLRNYRTVRILTIKNKDVDLINEMLYTKKVSESSILSLAG